MALSLLVASEQVRAPDRRYFAYGELGLDGRIYPVQGTLAAMQEAVQEGAEALIIPDALLEGLDLMPTKAAIYACSDLNEAVNALAGQLPELKRSPKMIEEAALPERSEFYTFAGQEMAQKALLIAACGWHHVLFCGSPGTGKTKLARALMDLLPACTEEERFKLILLDSRLSTATVGMAERRLLEPSVNLSKVQLLGGGTPFQAGIATLAHRGVLFLDEINEMKNDVKNCLRQLMEDREIRLWRQGECVSFPADFLLLAAMNPCRCGAFLDNRRVCRCSREERRRFQRKLDGALRDRFDLQVLLRTHDANGLQACLGSQDLVRQQRDKLKQWRELIQCAWDRQAVRCRRAGLEPCLNACLRQQDLSEIWRIPRRLLCLSADYAEQQALSARRFQSLLAVMRSLADLDDADDIRAADLDEAWAFVKGLELL